MTTTVTIDAHAGYAILVITLIGEPNTDQQIVETVVNPYEKEDFYIHSGCSIIHVAEGRYKEGP